MSWLRDAFSSRGSSDAAGDRAPAETLVPAGLEPAGPGDLEAPPLSSAASSAGEQPVAFRPGEFVEYYSATASRWIPARVTKVNPRGTYKLDCKPDVPAEKIRRPQPRSSSKGRASSRGSSGAGGPAGPSGPPPYSVGDRVEYFSATTKSWIPAKVVAITPVGTFDLDCKPDVAPEKIRKGGFGASSGAGAASSSSRGGRSGGSGQRRGGGGRPAAASGGPVDPPPSPVLDEPLQLIRVTRASSGGGWHYELCDSAARIIEAQGTRKIAVASVCGPYRSGKSYLMNLLMERAQNGQPLVQVGSTTTACTQGLWLWGAPAAEEEEARRRGDSPLLAFMDCEGFGSADSDRTRDAQMMALCALVSSVFVLNTMGALTESNLASLALICRFAEHVEDGGAEASRPALLWLLRDFALDLLSPSGQPVSPDEYLEQALASGTPATSTASGIDDDIASRVSGAGAQEARQSLQRFFGQRRCHTLVRPLAEEADLQSIGAVPFDALRPEFRSGFDALRASVLVASRGSPKAIGGQPLSCAAYVALLRQLVAALNGGRTISLRSAWASVQHTTCGELADRLRKDVCLRLRALASSGGGEGGGGSVASGDEGQQHSQHRLPLSDETLRELFEEERKKLREAWEASAVGDEAVRREYWDELEASVAREEAGVRMQNARTGDRKLTVLVDRWRDWLDSDGAPEAVGEELCAAFAERMGSAPGPSVARAAPQALSAARRRVLELRRAEGGSGVGAGGGAEGDGASASGGGGDEAGQLREARRQAVRAEEQAQGELQAKARELEDLQAACQEFAREAEAAALREREARALQHEAEEREASLLAELDNSRADATRYESERSASHAQVAGRSAELDRLKSQLEQVKSERDTLRASAAQSAGEAGDLAALQAQLAAVAEELRAKENAHRLAVEEAAGARRAAAEEGSKHQRFHAERESALRVDIDRAADAAKIADTERLAALRAARSARWEADAAGEEVKRLKDELVGCRAQVEALQRQLNSERSFLHGAHSQARAEHLKAVEAHKKRLEEEHKAHSETVESTRSRLLEHQRTAGQLEGKVEMLTAEASRLREQNLELQAKLREVERHRGQHLQEKEHLQWELRESQSDVRRAMARVEETTKSHLEASEYIRRLQEEARRKKCECILQ